MIKKRVLIEPLSWRFREFMLLSAMVSMMALQSCTTFLTRTFTDEYELRLLKNKTPVQLPSHRHFHGWDVYLNCESVLESNDEVRNDSSMYFLFIWPEYTTNDSTDTAPDDSLMVSEISLYFFLPLEEHMTLQLDAVRSLNSENNRLYFGRHYIPPEADSIKVEYTVRIANEDTGLSDSALFSYMLYRYENKRRIPIFFTGE